jgi:hypothetical protein
VWKTIGTNQWAPVNVGLTDLSVESLLMGPDAKLYAGTTGGMVWVLSDTSWTRLGTGAPAPSRISDLAFTPSGALCAAFGPIACMSSPSPTGTAQLVAGSGASGGNDALAVADGLLYMSGYGDVVLRLDLTGQCWRPLLPLPSDSAVLKILVTPGSILMATFDSLLTQAR